MEAELPETELCGGVANESTELIETGDNEPEEKLAVKKAAEAKDVFKSEEEVPAAKANIKEELDIPITQESMESLETVLHEV